MMNRCTATQERSFRKLLKPMLGVTALELMIAVSIIAILAAVAYPNYSEYIRRGQRAEARSVLLEATQFMQRYYVSNDTYTGAALPSALTQSPKNGTANYLIGISSVTDFDFALEAVPQGRLATDKCGTMSLTSTGVRGASGSATIADCWK